MNKNLKGKRILLVDDNIDFINFTREVLKLEGAEVECVYSGQEALDLLSSRKENFHIVLLDVFMPGIDGIEVTGKIREIEGLSNLPVIVMTGGSGSDLLDRSLSKGAFDFIRKPFTSDNLVSRIAQIFESMSI